jgi:outer membrane protein insertion porin family
LRFPKGSLKLISMARCVSLAAVLLASGFPVASHASAQTGQIIEDIDVKGNRRIPKETIMAKVFTHRGDIYEESSLQRDLRSVWSTGYFEDVRVEREESPKGWRIYFYVREKPTIRSIDYKGLSSISQSDVLERFKKAKLPLSI